METTALTYTAFEGEKVLASGNLEEVALEIKRRLKKSPSASVLIFSDSTGKEMDLDLSGSESDVLERLKVFMPIAESVPSSTGPGRPKLGVVAREVSLLPRHWEWLSTQNGGASATIRRLIEDARKDSSGKERVKSAQERAYKVMSVLAGNLPHYEEALRALYAKDKRKYLSLIGDWPSDIRSYSKDLAKPVWESAKD